MVSFLTPQRCALFAGGLALLVAAALITPVFSARYSLSEGDVAVTTIKSPRQVPPFPSESLTAERRERVAYAVPDVLIFDSSILARQISKARTLFQQMDQLRGSGGGAAQSSSISPQVLSKVAGLRPEEWREVQQETLSLLSLALSDRIAPEQLPSARAQAIQRISPSFQPDQKEVVSELLDTLLEPNLIVDPAATQRVRKAAMDQVTPVMVSVARGETLVRDGQIITALHMEKLGVAGLLDRGFQWTHLGGILLFCIALSTVMALYVYALKPRSLGSWSRLGLLALLLVAPIVAANLALPGRPVWAMAFPMVTSPMVLATLLGLPLGIMGALFTGFTVAYVADLSPQLLTYAPASPLDSLEKLALYGAIGLVGAVFIGGARRITQYLVAGSAAAVIGALIVLGFWLLSFERDLTVLSWGLVGVIAGGLMGAALAIGLIVLLGMAFGITTRIQLHELSQPDHPLLRQLLQEAPGTYYHSILVANLAEQACQAIGADALLARVGAYYHDIGKVQNPGFFIENQRRGENIHDRMDPLTSASMVIAHVRDGLRLAGEAKLPPQIQSFIAEHHGSRLAQSFYNAATHLNPNVNRDLFRYPGPAPLSRETGIVMLADSVEAVARSVGQQTPEELAQLVDRVVNERIAEGQLDNCELTLKDLEHVKTAFKSALRGIHHPRISYPAPAPAAVSAPVDPAVAAADADRVG